MPYRLWTEPSGMPGQSPERLLEKPIHTWQDNIKMGLREVVCDVDWIYLVQDRDQCLAVVNMVMNFWFHKRRVIFE
jgi:hypothetical protein